MSNKKKVSTEKSSQVAENSYQPSDYYSENEVEQGLATAHEQVSDAYMEGTIDGTINDYQGQDIKLPRGNYEETDTNKDK